MHATIDVWLTISINDDKTIPLATLAEFITDQFLPDCVADTEVDTGIPDGTK